MISINSNTDSQPFSTAERVTGSEGNLARSELKHAVLTMSSPVMNEPSSLLNRDENDVIFTILGSKRQVRSSLQDGQPPRDLS